MTSCFIIAEAGVNHNGDLDTAKKLIDAAADAGADAVKFQTFRAEELASPSAPKAPYQVHTTGEGSQQRMLHDLELSQDAYLILKTHAEDQGIQFCSTAFDPQSVDFLESLGIPFFKIPSGEVTNFPLIAHIAKKAKPVILSTGMSTLEEVRLAVQWLSNGPKAANGMPPLTVMHCVTAYPAPPEASNLSCIKTMSQNLGLPIGFSDHSLGISLPTAAVALGATILEKHLTLDCNQPGPDHLASLEPIPFNEMVKSVRNVERAIGDGIKRPDECEIPNISVVRRSIVAAHSIKKGDALTPQNLAVKRPGTGLSPSTWNKVIGSKATRDFEPDEPIEL